MKKVQHIFLSTVLGFGCSLPLAAQHKDSICLVAPDYIELSGGLGRPMGSFSSANAKPGTASTTMYGYLGAGGLALPGSSFNLDFSMPIHKGCNIGYAADIGYYLNRFDMNALLSCAAEEMNNPPDLGPEVWIPQTSYSTGYSILTIMPGFSTGITYKKFSLDIIPYLGVAYCTSPSVSFTALLSYPALQQNNIPEAYSANSSNAWALCSGGKIDLRYAISSKLSLSADYSIIKTSPVFHEVTTQWNTTTSTATTVNIAIYSLSLGLDYKLGK